MNKQYSGHFYEISVHAIEYLHNKYNRQKVLNQTKNVNGYQSMRLIQK